MKIFFKLLAWSFLIGCNAPSNSLDIDKMKVEIEIIPESGDGWYAISWNDTLGSRFNSAGNYLDLRPCELYCFVTNLENDTLGYYHGLSSPQQFLYFQTKHQQDSLIQVHYQVGINHFSEFLAKQNQEFIDAFNKKNKNPAIFQPLILNLSKVLRKKMVVELKSL